MLSRSKSLWRKKQLMFTLHPQWILSRCGVYRPKQETNNKSLQSTWSPGPWRPRSSWLSMFPQMFLSTTPSTWFHIGWTCLCLPPCCHLLDCLFPVWGPVWVDGPQPLLLLLRGPLLDLHSQSSLFQLLYVFRWSMSVWFMPWRVFSFVLGSSSSKVSAGGCSADWYLRPASCCALGSWLFHPEAWFWWSYLLVFGPLLSDSTLSGHWSFTINHTEQRILAYQDTALKHRHSLGYLGWSWNCSENSWYCCQKACHDKLWIFWRATANSYLASSPPL